MRGEGQKKKRGFIKWGIPLIIAVILAVLLLWYLTEGRYIEKEAPSAEVCDIVMIDVGQGDALLIRTADANVMIDTGPSSSRSALADYLEGAGIEKLDCLFLSHPHEDHIGNAAYVIENYSPERLVMPDAVTSNSCFERTLKAAERAGLEIEIPVRGDVYEFGGMKFTVLSSEDPANSGDLNRSSIVLRLDYGEVSALLTGDADIDNENEMLEKVPDLLDCDILKVGHHGSYSSSGDDFVKAVSPSVALISCGKDNEYGHPAARVLKTLEENRAKVFRTDERSTVIIETDGKTFCKK